MHVLIVSAVFPPEPNVTGQTSSQIATELVKKNHLVTVAAPFPSRPSGTLYTGYGRGLYQREKSPGGFDLVRCFSIPSPSSSILSRFLENLSFGISGGFFALTVKKPDVVYANTWPIFASSIIWLVTRLRRIPLVISVQDVYPESLVAQKRINIDSWIIKFFQKVDQVIARRCRAIIVISENFKNLYIRDRKIPAERVHFIPNWLDEKTIEIHEKDNSIRAAHDIPKEGFLIAYGGNIGVAAGVETVIDAFRYLKDCDHLYLLLAGGGSSLKECQKLAEEVDPGRIYFHHPWPTQETSIVLSAADILVLPTHGDQSLASVPSKLIAYMLSSRPVLALGLPHSDLARIVEQSGCGWVIEPGRPEKLADKIKEILAMDPQSLTLQGLAGREYALNHLVKCVNLPRVVSIIEQAAEYHPGS